MKNIDKIKAMTVEEMAEAISPLRTCSQCFAQSLCVKINSIGDCSEIIKDWLESEV